MKRIITAAKRMPPYFWLYAIVTLVTQLLTYWLPDVLDIGMVHLLGTSFDDATPFVPAFIYIYVGAFFFWIGGYAYLYSRNRAIADRLLTADLLCKAAGLLVFCLYPCTLKQPASEEITGVGAWLVKMIYSIDKPGKLLPSMHCYVSILLALPAFSKHAGEVPVRIRISFPLFGLAICASTLFVKQHVFVDVWTAAVLAVCAWMISLLLWKRTDQKRLKRLKS